jgi:hypothetical protein
MNKKRKVLTIAALAVFSVIIWLHYGPTKRSHYYGFYGETVIRDVRLPLFTLAVFYAGLFFIFGPSATKNRPP